ncbi:hypothetical protein K490DRAFT_56986 [Saccharata proteae CBS 121410]|uniref:Copper-fist domain-containing protein n=1 Tax=Saccharata proteae CBS 121410 TaxID=1314787 RepID=A0A9P4HWM2_9PEZI|nr:hypothetical protein K490DRAFT_56986 [Saccharata proteae CBS 121410]
MPWVETPSGEKKKVACGPCIRGHRSTTCQHKDRVLLELPSSAGQMQLREIRRKLYDTEHTEKGTAPVVDVTAFVAPPANASSGVQKTKHKKSVSRNPAAIDKAIKAGDEGENQFQIQAAKPCCGPKTSAAAPRARPSISDPASGLNSPSVETPENSRHSPASNNTKALRLQMPTPANNRIHHQIRDMAIKRYPSIRPPILLRNTQKTAIMPMGQGFRRMDSFHLCQPMRCRTTMA